MKKKLVLLANVLIALAVSQLAYGYSRIIQEEKEAVIKIEAPEGTKLDFKSSDKYVQFDTWENDYVEVKANVIFKGEEKDEIREFLDNFQEIVEANISNSGRIIDINGNINEPNKFQMGTKLMNFMVVSYSKKELSITYKVKVPSYLDIRVKNSYEELVMNGNFSGEVDVNHYSGDFFGEDFNYFSAQLKYGDASFNSIQNGKMSLYEQEIDAERIGKCEFEAKYSDLTIEKGGSWYFDGYESEINAQSVDKIEGELKYGKIEIEENLNALDLIQSYESEFEISSLNSLKVNDSKYSKYYAKQIESINLNSSYEDEFEIDEIGEIDMKSKYAKVRMGKLNGSLNLPESYETDVDVSQLGTDVSEFFVDGKYCKINLAVDNSSISVDLDAKYANIDYPEGLMEKRIYIKENSRLTVQLESKSGEGTVVKIRGYEMDLTIE